MNSPCFPQEHDGTTTAGRKSVDQNQGTWVMLPDLFTSIMSKEPVVNANYLASKTATIVSRDG